MPQMRAIQVSRPGGPFEIVEREIPRPGPRQVRVKVQACGVCHSDTLTKEGHFPGMLYPRVPGHEVAGVSTPSASMSRAGSPGSGLASDGLVRTAVTASPAVEESSLPARTRRSPASRWTVDTRYVLVSFEALAVIPDEISPIDAGPLMCAGITTFNSMRNSGARAGDTVAVLGIGGLVISPSNSHRRWAFVRSRSRAARTRSH